MFHIDIFIAAEKILRRPKADVVEAIQQGALVIAGEGAKVLEEEVLWQA